MKVFLSWSGEESKQLAAIFKDWLPNVIQSVEPYMSLNDILLGERWIKSVESELAKSSFGLVFVTPENINSPWINFEAGALTKTYNSKVVPLIYNSDITILENGPLNQFQSAQSINKESILELLKSIVKSDEKSTLNEKRLDKAFLIWWPDLEKKVSSIKPELKKSEHNPSQSEMLKAVVIKLNQQEKDLRFLKDAKSNKLQISERISIGKMVELKKLQEKFQVILPEMKKIIEYLSTDSVNQYLSDVSISEEGKKDIIRSKEKLSDVIHVIEYLFKED